MIHQGHVACAAYSPDGKAIAITSYNLAERWHESSDQSAARLWHFPALVADDFPRIKVWVETMTSLEVDDRGSIAALETEAWQQRPEQLGRLGRPPKADSGWLLESDPVWP